MKMWLGPTTKNNTPNQLSEDDRPPPEKGWTRLSTSKRERAKKRNFCVSLLRGCNFFFRPSPLPDPLNIKGKCRGRGINTGGGDLDFGFQRFVLQTFIGFFTFDQKCAEIASPRSRTRTKRKNMNTSPIDSARWETPIPEVSATQNPLDYISAGTWQNVTPLGQNASSGPRPITWPRKYFRVHFRVQIRFFIASWSIRRI